MGILITALRLGLRWRERAGAHSSRTMINLGVRENQKPKGRMLSWGCKGRRKQHSEKIRRSDERG